MANVLVLTDRPELPQASHNYNKALRWLRDNGKLTLARGKAYDIQVQHDNHCHVYDGHLCNCRPNIIVNRKRLRYPAKILRETA